MTSPSQSRVTSYSDRALSACLGQSFGAVLFPIDGLSQVAACS